MKEKIFRILGCIESGISTNTAPRVEDKNRRRYFSLWWSRLILAELCLVSTEALWGTLSGVVKVELSWMSFELQVPNIPACVPRSQTIEPNPSHSQIVITSAPCRSRPIDSSRWMTTGKGQWLAAGLRSFVWCRGRGNSLYRAEDMLHLLRSYYSVDLLWTQFCSVLETLLVTAGW